MLAHITATCKAANFNLYCLSRIKKYLSPQALKTAVHVLISSRIDYCNSLLVGLPATQTNRLQHILNSAACLISGTKKCDHISPVLSDLHWLPVNRRILFKLLCLTFKALNGLAPQYLADQLQSYTPARALHSADQGLLCIPKICTKKFGARTFAHAAPYHYNELPIIIRQSTSLALFMNHLKTHFFRLSYPDC